jgi:hypothetical protein
MLIRIDRRPPRRTRLLSRVAAALALISAPAEAAGSEIDDIQSGSRDRLCANLRDALAKPGLKELSGAGHP